jgi:hypothetical protein
MENNNYLEQYKNRIYNGISTLRHHIWENMISDLESFYNTTDYDKIKNLKEFQIRVSENNKLIIGIKKIIENALTSEPYDIEKIHKYNYDYNDCYNDYDIDDCINNIFSKITQAEIKNGFKFKTIYKDSEYTIYYIDNFKFIKTGNNITFHIDKINCNGIMCNTDIFGYTVKFIVRYNEMIRV